MIARMTVFVVLGIFLAAAPAWSDDLTGRQVIDEVSKRHEKSFEFEKQRMILTDGKSGATEEREVRRYVRKDDGEFKYLVVFHEPAGIKGVALLTWQHEDKDDDQWLYLPAYGKKMKRIAKGGRKNYFMGTDYAFEDLVSESKDKFKYTREADQTLDGADHYVVMAAPVDKKVEKSSGYKHRILFVRKDIFFITRTDYFDKRGKFIKRQLAQDLSQVDGDLWRAAKSVMENEKENHTTVTEIVERSFEKKLVKAKKFQQRFVTSGKHLRD